MRCLRWLSESELSFRYVRYLDVLGTLVSCTLKEQNASPQKRVSTRQSSVPRYSTKTMAEITAFSDPTDWKGSSLQPLEHLDVALRCEVCKEFYNAPMITACCHTFCSLCIRRALDRDKRCPICRTESQEYTLRKNTAVQDLLEAFTGCRQQLLEFATKEKVPGRKVEEVVEAGDKDIMMSSQGSQRSQRSQRQSQSQRQRKFVGEYSEDGDGDYIGSLSPPPGMSPLV